MNIHEHTTIALYDDGGEQIGNYTRGEEEFRLLDGKHSVAFNVTEAADLIAFLQRVQDIQKGNDADVRGIMKPEPQPVDLTKAKPGDVCVRRDGTKSHYQRNDGTSIMPHMVGGFWHYDDGRAFRETGGESKVDIIQVIPSDHSGPSGTACDTLPVGNQRDPGDETPDDEGFVTVRPRPRRDGPGLDVKGLACVADLESRN